MKLSILCYLSRPEKNAEEMEQQLFSNKLALHLQRYTNNFLLILHYFDWFMFLQAEDNTNGSCDHSSAFTVVERKCENFTTKSVNTEPAVPTPLDGRPSRLFRHQPSSSDKNPPESFRLIDVTGAELSPHFVMLIFQPHQGQPIVSRDAWAPNRQSSRLHHDNMSLLDDRWITQFHNA